jgi:pyridoxal 5'-phosphate synthase pdxT subunit
VEGIGPDPLRAVFIRAPWIERHGPALEVLASWEGHPVVARQGSVLVCAFHPELTDDGRIHAMFMAMVTESAGQREAAR